MSNVLELIKQLKKNNINAYLVPIRDEFGCEYVPNYNKRLEFITNFSGSNGFAIITPKKNAFFTDGRYTLQAKLEINKDDFEIFDFSEKTIESWIIENLADKSKIGYDPSLFSITEKINLETKLSIKNIKLIEINHNLIDEIWHSRPTPIKPEIFTLEKKYTGKTASEKIKEVTNLMQVDYAIITSCESICWLLNIRGNSLSHTPVIFSYAIISKKGEVYIYSDLKALQKIENKINADLFIRNFSEFENSIKKFSGKTFEADFSSCTIKLQKVLEQNKCKLINRKDICLELRAIKNKVELENIKKAHIEDGLALCKFLYWIYNFKKSPEQSKKLNEISISDKLESFRKQSLNYHSLSFDTIAGWNENGAIIHYRSSSKTNKQLKGNGLLLLDSGAQYYYGTTDVTRTICLGSPSSEQKRNYTLVLKGHISLAKQKFLKGTSGSQLDILARQFLWQNNLDYKHGTGHGVGYFLNVHEGPHAINKYNSTPLKEGMIISNEPGYYKQNAYGIRLENLISVKQSNHKNFLEFETLTQVPFDKNLIDKKLLTKDELQWINSYHKNIFDLFSKKLSASETAWLKQYINL
jgi:Xaa-Pro aminopeptidase